MAPTLSIYATIHCDDGVLCEASRNPDVFLRIHHSGRLLTTSMKIANFLKCFSFIIVSILKVDDRVEHFSVFDMFMFVLTYTLHYCVQGYDLDHPKRYLSSVQFPPKTKHFVVSSLSSETAD